MTFKETVKMKEKMLEIKQQSCRVLFKDYYCRDIIMQIHFVPFDESFLCSQSLWADFRDEKWQFSDEGDSWWDKPSSDAFLDAGMWGEE